MNSFLAFFTRIAAIAGKEVRQLRRDRLTAGMIVGIPLMQILIFGYGINMDVRHLRAAVADAAHTSASRALVADLEAGQVVHFVATVAGPAQLRELMAAGKISAGLYIPPDFERRRIEGDRPIAQLMVDGSAPGVAEPLRALANLPPTTRPGIRPADPRTLEVLTEYNPERRTPVQIVPALIGVILSMTMVVFTAVSLVRERERGNLELLITTPVKSVELMIGKLAPYVLVGLVQTTIILVTGVLLFDVPINGNIVQLYVGATLFIAATLSLGLVISTLVQTQFQAMQLGFLTLLPSILLSGFMFPFDGMPPVVQWIAQILPLTHFNDIVRGVVLRGAELRSLLPSVTKLSIFLVAAVSLAALRFRKSLG
ncbi:MAG TPA: ABC transporter permease [Steroidobacteraceae bacterium]|jgi:ABC-2 type transport system permease protein